jgi:hypothetical protein
MERYEFEIPVGDWSDDGHGKCEYYRASATKPFEDVCKAFVKARQKLGISPEEVCSDYQEGSPSTEIIEAFAKAGYQFPEDFFSREMAELIVWYLNEGDPGLDARLQPEDEQRSILRNWEFVDITGENLDQFGYGLFE